MAKHSLDEETTKKVIRQVEFYFSDSNLPRDDFLSKTVNESEDGMVSLALLCSFNRMRKHLKLADDTKPADVKEETVKAVAEVLKNAASLKLSEDGSKVGRITELPKPEEVIEQVEIRTIAASPFEYTVKLEEVESFFGQYAKVNSVRLPRHVGDKKFFCGTALVEFSSDEEMQNVLKQKLVYAGAELELKPKQDFDAEREKELEKHEKSRKNVGSNHEEDNTNTEEDYPKGLVIAFKLKSSSDEVPEKNSTDQQANDNNDVTKTDEQKPSEVAAEESDQKMSENDDNDKENYGVNEGKEAEGEEKEQEKNGVKEEKETEVEEKGQENNGAGEGKVTEGVEKGQETGKKTAVIFKNDSDVVLREDLKVVFQKFGDVKYIDFNMGDESGFIRFDEPEAAQKARAAAALSEKGGLVVKNYIATLDPVTGEAEKQYWSQLRGKQDIRRESFSNRGRGGGRYGRGGKFSRNRDNDSGRGRQNKYRKY